MPHAILDQIFTKADEPVVELLVIHLKLLLQLDDGLIGFGDDLIQYCMWQVRPPVSGETKGEAPPPLPATFSTAPAPALCKRVLFGGPVLAPATATAEALLASGGAS